MKLFTEQQYRGLLILVPVAVVLVAISVALELLRPAEQTEVKEEWLKPAKGSQIVEENDAEIELKPFDPNTYSYEQLRAAGLRKEIAVSIVRWRSYGKVYRLREDLALVSGVSDSLYAVLKPYIIIADSVAAKPKPQRWQRESYTPAENKVVTSAKTISETQTEKQEISLGNKPADSTWRSRKIGAREPLVDINSADTAALIALRGIGSKSAAEIVKYRELLGGYHSVEQISEIKTVTEQNYEKILQQIYCDSCEIQKIDINFAAPKEIARHPYVSAAALRKIIKQRQLKGGWSRIEEMVEDEILSEDEAKRLAPYLWFRLDATE
ncbi:MAG: helix-hairpin-helix domain-containing protein [Rikenellaceae bacterium]|nr:helix-hairpin-helix domain-containing protein [Rikenellaceae bacterium]